MENNRDFPLLLDRKDVVLIKPAKSTPLETLSLSTIDNDPNLDILCHSVYVYQANSVCCSGNANHLALASKQPDPACVIKDAISKVLVHYHPFAGKLKRHSNDGNLYINCNGEGVPFLEANAKYCNLASLHYLDGIDVETAKEFVFDFPSKSEFGYHPLTFQLTKFSCGGFTIGMGLSHSVCDGFGASQFFRALAELASGKSEPTIKPLWERERLVVKPNFAPLKFPVDKASLATSPYMPTDDIQHECFNINSKTIKRLKISVMKECGDDEALKEKFTTVEVLGAYIWRARVRAFKLNPDGRTLFCLAMGVRHLLNPPLPSGYYGNAFVGINVVLMAKDLNEGLLSEVIKLIKESKKLASNDVYIWNQVDMLDKVRQLNIKIDSDNGASMVLTDWRQLGLLEEVDFGWKGLVNMVPVPLKMFGYIYLCIFLPPCSLDPSMKGGVRVLVSLPKAVMPKFKEEMNALSQIGDDDHGSNL